MTMLLNLVSADIDAAILVARLKQLETVLLDDVRWLRMPLQSSCNKLHADHEPTVQTYRWRMDLCNNAIQEASLVHGLFE